MFSVSTILNSRYFFFDTKKWSVIFAISATLFISNTNLTAVNLALPFMAHDFHASLTTIPWVISSYIITAGMFMILGGRIGDVFGIKRVLSLSLVLWFFSLGLAGAAESMPMLILARVLQGIAFAFSLPLCMVGITRVFPKERIGLAISINITVLGLAQVLGPTLAGFLLQYLNWHWIFFVSMPFIFLAFIFTLYGMAKDKNVTKNEDMDYVGAALLVLGLLGLMFIFSSIQQNIMRPQIVFLLSATVLFIFSCFYFFEKKVSNPIIDFDLLFNSSFFTINIIRVLFQFLYFVLLYVLPLYLLNIVKIPPVETGVFLLYMTVPFACASFIVGRVVNFIRAEWLILLSFLGMLGAFILLSNMRETFSRIQLIISLLLSGLATAVVFSCSTSIALALAPTEKKGVASGIFFTNTLIGGAIGVSLSAILMQALSHYYLLQHSANSLFSVKVETKAFIFSFNGIMLMCIIVAFIGCILACLQMRFSNFQNQKQQSP